MDNSPTSGVGAPPPLPASRRVPVLIGAAVLLVLLVGGALVWSSLRTTGGINRQVEGIFAEIRRNENGQTRVGLRSVVEFIRQLTGGYQQTFRSDYEFQEDLKRLGTNAVPRLLQALHSDTSVAVRRVSAATLGSFSGTNVLTGLTTALGGESDETVRTATVHGLYELGDAAAIPALQQGLKSDASIEVRAAIPSALLHLGGDAQIAMLLQQATNETALEVRGALARAFGDYRVEPAMPFLLNALVAATNSPSAATNQFGYPSPNQWVVEAAARDVINAIGRIGTEAGFAALTNRWTVEKVPQLKVELARSLGNFGDRRALALLVASLRQRGPDDLREEVVSAIGQIGDPSVLPAIEPLLDDSHAEVRRAAIVAVGQLGATNAVPKLVSILNSAVAGDIQRAVVGALANIGEPSTSDAIISRLGSMPGDRSELIWALAHTGGSNAPAAIAPLLDGRDREERFAAAFALVALRDRTIVPQLRARATDKDEFARHAKGCALVMLGDPLGLDEVRAGLNAKEIWRRFASALALTYPGGAGKPEDAAALENDRSGVIANFAKTARNEDPVRALIALLATKHDEMPTYAAKALWFFDDPRALPELKKATERTDSGLREAARTAIMRIERRTAQTPGPTPTAAR